MKKFTVAAVAAGFVAADVALAAPAPAAAGGTTMVPLSQTDSQNGTVALPPGGPIAIYPGPGISGGANPYVPFGTNPYTPYGVWNP